MKHYLPIILTTLALLAGCSDPETTPAPAACAPGTLACPCVSGTCGEAPDGTPLACEADVCVIATEVNNMGENNINNDVSGQVTDPAVRSCEVLLNEGDAWVTGATFGGAVKGDFMRQAPHVAVAFHAAEDAPITTSVMQLAFERGATSDLSVTSVRCFDAGGAELDGDLFRL